MPKVLFTEKYKGLSAEAKLLYGLMLDRMQLSAINGWCDKNGEVFIFYTIAETSEMLGCGHDKATYVCELYTDDRGMIYQFSYRIAGTIIDAPSIENVEKGHCCHETYPYGAPNFPEPHFDLEFFEILPWVLDVDGN